VEHRLGTSGVGYIPLIYVISVKAAFRYKWNAVFIGYPSICLSGQNMTMASLSQDRVMCRHVSKHNIEVNLKETGLLLNFMFLLTVHRGTILGKRPT
jgi:hypothetical protein